ncbi:formate hydrogenlyase [Odoribacter splanchnicus]|nr:formate hydrogenlyase [Odoribacter splanchnicus]
MKHDLNCNLQRQAKRLYALFACLVLTLPFAVVPAFAADDPLSVVTSLSDFIFSLIRAVGLILLGYGILQVGLSLQSHDPSQRSNGILTIAGGIVITFTKEILTLITGG